MTYSSYTLILNESRSYPFELPRRTREIKLVFARHSRGLQGVCIEDFAGDSQGILLGLFFSFIHLAACGREDDEGGDAS